MLNILLTVIYLFIIAIMTEEQKKLFLDYLSNQWLLRVQNKENRPPRNEVIEIINNYARQDWKDWNDDYIAMLDDETPEFEEIQEEVLKIIKEFVKDNWIF